MRGRSCYPASNFFVNDQLHEKASRRRGCYPAPKFAVKDRLQKVTRSHQQQPGGTTITGR
jgi:hypothetical protein